LGSIPQLSTTAIPITQTRGFANSASSVIMGDFSQAILGMREELRLIRLDQTFAANGQIGFWARLRADVAFAHGQSFASLFGVLP
jgi:HK97 family phage major capsid protein